MMLTGLLGRKCKFFPTRLHILGVTLVISSTGCSTPKSETDLASVEDFGAEEFNKDGFNDVDLNCLFSQWLWRKHF